MKIAHYDETTKKLLGWYDKNIHTTVPTPNIEVSDEVWQNAIDENANFVDFETDTLSVNDFRTQIEIDAEIETKRQNDIKDLEKTKKNEVLDADDWLISLTGAISLINKKVSGSITGDEQIALDALDVKFNEIAVLKQKAKDAIANGTAVDAISW